MKILNKFKKLSFFLVLLIFTAGSVFAQTYVSNTNGDDLNGDGTAVKPYKTIAVGITNTADGGTIMIDAGTYNEAAITIGKGLTLVSQAFNGLTTVTITNTLEVDAAGKTVNLGVTGESFLLNGGLTLTDGDLKITTANVTLASGTTITRTDGTIDNTPTVTNVNVTYDGAVDITAGAELPADLGTGNLTNNISVGTKTLTIGKSVTFNNYAAPAANASLDVTAGSFAVDGTFNSGTGTSSFGGSAVTFSGAFTVTAGGTVEVTAGTALFEAAVTVGAGGLLDLQVDATMEDALTVNGDVKLNSTTLTWGNTTGASAITNTGEIYSAASTTVGSAKILVVGDQANTIEGLVVSVEIPASNTGSLTTSNDLTVYGSVTVSSASAGALTGGAGDAINVYGDFARTDNTAGNVDFITNDNVLSFLGSSSRFDPGEDLRIHELVVNLAAAADVLTMDESVSLEGDLTITTGTLALGSRNLRFVGAAAQTFTNNGAGYTTDTNGFVIFENGQAANGILGSAPFANLDIRAAGTGVGLGGDIDFSGILNVRQAGLDLNGHTLTFTDDWVTVPTVNYWTDNAAIINSAGAQTFAVAAGIEYDINYYGDLTTQASATELIAAGIRNLNIATTAAGAPDLILPQATTITGKLTVATGETFDIAAGDFTMSGDAIAHSVLGEVLDVTGPALTQLVVTGDGSSIVGSTDDADSRSIENLQVSIAAGETFNISNIENVTGNVVVDNGTVGISLIDDPTNDNDGQFDGNLTITDGTVTLTIADEADGDDATQENIEGNLLINDGTLVLGNTILVDGTTDLGAGAAEKGSIQLGNYNLIAGDQFTHNGVGNITGDGFLVLDYTVGATSQNFILTTPLDVSNLEINDGGAATTITQLTDDLTVTNSLLFTAGTYDIAALDLTLTGNSLEYVAGALNGTGNFILNGTTMQADLKADFTVNPNLELNATSLTIVDANAGPYTLTAAADFTQTAGDVIMNDNSVELKADFTRVAGNWTQTTGYLWLNTIGTIDHGNSFTIDNLKVEGAAATFPDEQAWRIEKNLILVDVNLNPGDDNAGGAGNPQLTFGANATIERQDNLAQLGDKALYDGDINLKYTTDAGGITTSDEASSATINDVLAEVPVTMDRDVQINGTLTIDRDGNTGSVADGGNDLKMADGTTIKLVLSGGNANMNAFITAGPVVPAGKLNLYFDINGAVNLTTSDDAFDPAFTITDVTVDGIAGSNVNIHDDITINGTLLINNVGDLDLSGWDLTLAGAYTQTNTGAIVNSGAAAAVLFGGSTNSDITLNQDWVVNDANYTLGINTANADVVKTLKGGDIDFATNAADLKLMQGVFATDATSAFVLFHSDDNAGGIIQGFTRTGDSHVAGNVRKYLDATGLAGVAPNPAVALTRVEFPVGSEPSSPSHYRPFTLQFTTLPTANTNITVNHVNTKPAGTNGMPISTDEGFTITNFSDFYWTMTSDVTLQSQVKYDVEAAAEGYEDQYEDDEVQYIRFVRRFAANDDNPWVLQGASGYDNSTNDGPPKSAVVIAKDAEGAVSNQSAIFAYSQRNQAPHFTAKLADPTNMNEGDTLTFTYTIDDNDVTNQDLSMFAVTLPTGATFDAASGDFAFGTDNHSAGTYTVKIGATDGIDTSYAEASIVVADVNTAPVWSVIPGDTTYISEGVLNTIQYTATDADTDNVMLYSILPVVPATATIDPATGLLSITPAFGTVGDEYTLNVQADDQAGAANSAIQNTTLLIVTKTNRAPAFVNEMANSTINEGEALAFTYTAADPDGDALTFSLGAAAPAGATIDATTGDFAWTPGYTQAGAYTFKVWVTDDGNPNMSDSSEVTITVNDQNAPPTWVTVLPDTTIFVGETLTFTYVAEDLDLDVLAFSLDMPNPETLSITGTTDNTVTIEWTPVVTDTALYIIGMNAADGTNPSIRTEARVTVAVTTVDISGVVSYNVSGELLDAVTVTLSNGTDSWTSTTGADGAYSFTGVQSGDYTITAAKTTEWGGALASDALETQLHVAYPDSSAFLATDLQKVAADVVGVGNITSSDALAILNRSVGINDFQIDDWQFESASITVGTQDIVQNLAGIAAGDARNDYSPAAGLAKASNISVSSDDVLNIKKESEFELPISINEVAEIGSYTFKLSYAADKVEFLGATTNNGGVLVSNVVDDVISIAWANLDSKNVKVKDGDALVTLKFKATEQFSKSDEVSLELLDGAELTDGMAKSFNAGISIPVVAIGIPDVFALRQNYPNPFNPSTTIQYDLPENGKVTLTVYNSLGQEVAKLVNQKQEAGAYEVNFNASNLASGVYLYRVIVEGSKNFVMTKKMILMK